MKKTCSVKSYPSTDLDSDTLNYTFPLTVNGVEWTGTPDTTTYIGDSIHNSLLFPGDIWTCAAEVSDGQNSVTSDVSSIEIITCPLQYEYDVVNDFSNPLSPPECWSVGYSSDPTSPNLQDLYYNEIVGNLEWLGINPFDISDHITGIAVTPEGVDHAPEAIFESRNNTQQFHMTHNPNTFKMVPGEHYIYLRWTAPITTTCDFDFTFLPVSYFYQPYFYYYVDTTLRLRQNHSSVYFATIYGYNNNLVTMDENISVNAGDVLDFVIPPTPDNRHLHWVQMTGAITCAF